MMAPFHFGWGVLLLMTLVTIDLLARVTSLLVRRAYGHLTQVSFSPITRIAQPKPKQSNSVRELSR